MRLVEPDPVRGGERICLASKRPPRVYHALVSKDEGRPPRLLPPFTLRDPLPVVRIPPLRQHEEVLLDFGDLTSPLCAAYRDTQA